MVYAKSVKEEISSNLLFYRKKAHLTQKELAAQIGVKNNTISQWENGTNSIDVEILFHICEVLGISVSSIYGAYSNAQDVALSSHDLEHLKKYRAIDQRGKEMVDTVLNLEYTRCETAQDLSSIATFPHEQDFQSLTKEQKIQIFSQELDAEEKGTTLSDSIPISQETKSKMA